MVPTHLRRFVPDFGYPLRQQRLTYFHPISRTWRSPLGPDALGNVLDRGAPPVGGLGGTLPLHLPVVVARRARLDPRHRSRHDAPPGTFSISQRSSDVLTRETLAQTLSRVYVGAALAAAQVVSRFLAESGAELTRNFQLGSAVTMIARATSPDKGGPAGGQCSTFLYNFQAD